MTSAREIGGRSVTYPLPRAWAHIGRRARFGYAFCLTFACIFLVTAWVTARDHHLIVATAAVLAAMTFVLQLRTDRLRRTRQKARSPHPAGARMFRSALLLRGDDREFAADLGSAVCGMVGCGLAFYAVGTGELDLSFTEHSPKPFSPYAFVVVAALCAFEAIRLSVRRGPALTVSPRGLVVGKGGRRAEWTWDAVTTIEPRGVPVEGSRRHGAWLTIGDGDLEPQRPDPLPLDPIRLDAAWLGAPVTFWLVDFYHRHPELRHELGDGRVLGRLADGSLVEDAHRHV
ncbi:hypothetical protein ACLQ3C_04320 [Gordonia sp. DT30]|uniref:hypothetical protein n=1 Tax=Gordonia sp. DT30 TaxID=3416546 RepID=UPI003CEFD21E